MRAAAAGRGGRGERGGGEQGAVGDGRRRYGRRRHQSPRSPRSPRSPLIISEATAKTHVGPSLMELGLRDRAQAVVFAYESGVVRPGTSGAR
jgi:hypothetical protein